MKRFKAEEVLPIIENLIGQIKPVGETNTDNDRFENLKEMCDLVNSLIGKIDAVGYDFKDYQEFSIKRAAHYASDYLTNIVGIVNE